MAAWDPALYERYKDYRDRPALDLMLRIPVDLAPGEIWDLGCGTGEHAAVLAARHPSARVHGLDSSPEMLALARARSARVDWVEGDIAGFHPEVPPDLIFTNAALHWLPGLPRLVPRLVRTLANGGVFACQVPLSLDTAWYDALCATAAEPPWADKLTAVDGTKPVPPAEDWHSWLAAFCREVDIWTSTYLHILEGDDPIVDWMSGTGLRPYLQALPDKDERLAFTGAYARRLAGLFPRCQDGTTLFPFPRLFVVARR
ncbi:MAG TPA: methyltransferase domain-containing protein [Caulobacteraceae bacterium]